VVGSCTAVSSVRALLVMATWAGKSRWPSRRSQRDVLTPIVKAFGFGYVTSTLPRLPAAIKTLLASDLPIQQKLELLTSVLTSSLSINRFPTSCALIVGGSTLLPRLLRSLLLWLRQRAPLYLIVRLLSVIIREATLVSAFASAWVAFKLLNRDEGWARRRANSPTGQVRPTFDSPNQHHLPPPDYHVQYAGKTIDFTLFAFCRAIDVVAISAWISCRGSSFHPVRVAPQLTGLLKTLADPWVFSTSSAVIMWSWFFAPERLPKSYNQWISKIAEIDSRLVQALRLCRQGDLVYGSSTTEDADLPSLCKELDLPQEWGNPAVIVPIPCELYHCGAGKSCEVHAGKRFWKSFSSAMRLYLPLQSISLLRRPRFDYKRMLNVAASAVRSSSFLATFVSLFYYAVCLARTRLGPRIFSRKTVTPQMWDSGLCVLAGCLACGWSILLERASRRQDIAFFVAPRALATLLPRVYDKRYQRREQIVFATSVAIVMSAVQKKHHNVRGVLGKILERVLH